MTDDDAGRPTDPHGAPYTAAPYPADPYPGDPHAAAVAVEERGEEPAVAPTASPGKPRPRRWVVALALLTVFALGVAGGVAADRHLAVDCRSCPPPAGEGTPLLGTVESVGDGVLAVRVPDGTLVALRTSQDTRLVAETPSPLTGLRALGRGTPVRVIGLRDADGALTATTVGVPR